MNAFAFLSGLLRLSLLGSLLAALLLLLRPLLRGRVSHTLLYALWLLVVLRLIPAVPYNLINYAFGLTGMGLPQYLLASAVGIIPGTLVFINIGDKALDPSAPAFWLAIGLLVLLLAATALLGRRLFPDTTENGEET